MPQYKLLTYAFEGINIKPSAGKPGFITFKMTEPQFQKFQTNQANGPPPQKPSKREKAPGPDDGESIEITVDPSEKTQHDRLPLKHSALKNLFSISSFLSSTINISYRHSFNHYMN